MCFLYFYIIVWKKQIAPNSLSSILDSVRVLQGLRISLYDYPKAFQFLLLIFKEISQVRAKIVFAIFAHRSLKYLSFTRENLCCDIAQWQKHCNILQFSQKIIFFCWAELIFWTMAGTDLYEDRAWGSAWQPAWVWPGYRHHHCLLLVHYLHHHHHCRRLVHYLAELKSPVWRCPLDRSWTKSGVEGVSPTLRSREWWWCWQCCWGW